ncbi:MAG: hypothetical protein J5804_03645, partial [Eggerthellaceae bacterium]|nr:hypothetical protein [Eggerthellaceae bacterium]
QPDYTQPQTPPQPAAPEGYANAVQPQQQAASVYDGTYPQAQPAQPAYDAMSAQPQPYVPQAPQADPAAGAWQQAPAADPYAQPAVDPYAQPVADPYAQQAANQYAQPVADSYAQQATNQYAQPANPYVQPGMPPVAPTVPAPEKNGKATGALVCGILAILTSPTIIVGIILGIVAIVLARGAKKKSPDGKATGGLVCGAIGLGLSVIMLAIGVITGVAVYDALKDDPEFQQLSGQNTTTEPADPKDAFVGTWNYESVTVYDDSMTSDDIEAIASLGLTLTFNADGTCSLNAPSDSLDGTWEAVDSSEASISFEGSPATATISGNTLTLKEEGDEITFTRGSSPAPSASSTGTRSDVIADDSLCTIKVTNMEIDSDNDLRIDFTATNNSGSSIEIYGEIDSWKVNGNDVDGYCYTPLEPGETMDDFFFMEAEKLPSTNINDIESLTGVLVVEDSNGNKTSYNVNL